MTVPENSRALPLGESPAAHSTRRVTLLQASAYFRLGKFQIYEHWLPVIVAWSALENRLLGDVPVLATLLLVGLTAACIAGAGSALDDVQGIRDGIDLLTYQPSETERNIRTKPLLLGEMQESNAVRFAIAIAALGLTGILAAAVIAPHLPTWLLVVFVIVAFAATQYSYGLKFSYHGLGEVLLAVANAATLPSPTALPSGTSLAASWSRRDSCCAGWRRSRSSPASPTSSMTALAGAIPPLRSPPTSRAATWSARSFCADGRSASAPSSRASCRRSRHCSWCRHGCCRPASCAAPSVTAAGCEHGGSGGARMTLASLR